ncbi:hypothetical protein NC651_029369 [Populus alba x Populus x berolinensis]|nr:hypothetical protein NC651_029369 [Populus alba x Populus x berolinensis]
MTIPPPVLIILVPLHCISISSVPYGAPPQIPPPPLSSFINHHALLVFPAAEIQCSTPPTVIFTTPV